MALLLPFAATFISCPSATPLLSHPPCQAATSTCTTRRLDYATSTIFYCRPRRRPQSHLRSSFTPSPPRRRYYHHHYHHRYLHIIHRAATPSHNSVVALDEPYSCEASSSDIADSAPVPPSTSSPSSPSPDTVEKTSSSNGRPATSSPATPLPSIIEENAENHSDTQHTTSATSPPSPQPPPENEPPPGGTQVPITIGSKTFSIPSRSLLYSVPFLWGSFAPAVRFLFSQNPHQIPSVFNSERLLISTLVYVPVLLEEARIFLSLRANPNALNDNGEGEGGVDSEGKNPFDRFSFLPAGIELGFYVFLANIAQVVGLQQTSASRAAFLVQLQTVFVPILGTLLGLDRIKFTNGLSSMVAIAGVALLSSDKAHAVASTLTGDALEVVSAMFFSAYIVRLARFCNSVSPTPLVASKIAAQAILSVGWAIFAESADALRHVAHTTVTVAGGGVAEVAPWTLSAIAINVAVVLWTGLFPSAVSGWAQTKGQQGVAPSEAVLIFATQPLWSTAIAAVLLGEQFGPRGFAGGALIVLSSLLPSITKSIPLFQRLNKIGTSEKDR